MEGRKPIAPPVPTPGTGPFWAAAARGELLYGRCGGCGRAHYYPRHHCPFCHGSDVAWEAAKGAGQIYSFSIMRRAPAPYAIAYVELDEGPRVLTNLVAPSLDALHIGQRVRVMFAEAGDMQVPLFTPDLPGEELP